MPSPAAAAPAIAPATPAIETPAAPLNVLDATDDQLAERYGVKEAESEGEPEVQIVRDAEAPPVEAEAEAAPAADAEPEAAEAKAPPVIKAPITPFAVFDAEGEVEIPDIKITFKAGGKEYEQTPLDKVVRMAQSAPLAEQYREAAEKLPQVEQTAQQIHAAYQKAVADIEANNALYERLLSNPDLYVQAVEAYQRLNSPEARAQRAEQEMQALRQQQQQVQQQQQAQHALSEAMSFAQARIAPAVDALQQQYASVIEPEEFADRFHSLTADLLEAGPHGRPWVPPTKLPEVERRIQTDLAQWAEAKASKRRATHASATQQAQTEVKQAQSAAQQANRKLARAVAPARTPVAPDVPREKPIKTAQDAVEAALERVRRQVSGAA